MCLFPDRALLKFRRFTRGLTDNTSMVHGDRESTASAILWTLCGVSPTDEKRLFDLLGSNFCLRRPHFVRETKGDGRDRSS
jgi:hypothetical protein